MKISFRQIKNLCRYTESEFRSLSLDNILEDGILSKIFHEAVKVALKYPFKSKRWCILKAHAKLNGDKT